MNGSRTRPGARFAVVALVAVLAAGLFWGLATAVASSDSPSPASGKTILRLGWTVDPDSLNPFVGFLSSSYEVWALNYDILVGMRSTDLSRPQGLDQATGLAYKWSHSPDGLVWTFKVRDDVKWQDGVRFTAADVAFTYNYIIKGDMGNFTSYTQFIDHVTAPDPTTVKIFCTRPKANMLSLWIPILPEHIWSKIPYKAAGASFQNPPPIIGTGPFQVVERKKDEYVRLVANKEYWRGAPKIDEIIFEIYTNQDTMTMDLKSGDIDVAFGVPVAQFNALKSEPGITTRAADQKYLVELAFNSYASPDSQGNPVLRDPRFRQAVSWAVDKQKIVATCMGGYADVGQSILVPSTIDAWTPTGDEAFGYDPKKAEQLLDAAGYRDTDGDGIREDHDGKPIRLRLWTREESPEQQRAGQLIAGALKSIGIGITLQVMNDASISDGIWTYRGDTYAPDYDLFIWGWSGNIDPDYMLADFVTSQIEMWNDCCWSNKQYDALYQAQASEMDAARRKAEVTRMQQIFYEAAPYAVLYYPRELIAYDTARWEGWVPYPDANGLVVLSGDNIDTYLKVHPRAAATQTSGGSAATRWIVLAAVVAVIVVVVALLLVRRGRARELTE